MSEPHTRVHHINVYTKHKNVYGHVFVRKSLRACPSSFCWPFGEFIAHGSNGNHKSRRGPE